MQYNSSPAHVEVVSSLEVRLVLDGRYGSTLLGFTAVSGSIAIDHPSAGAWPRMLLNGRLATAYQMECGGWVVLYDKPWPSMRNLPPKGRPKAKPEPTQVLCALAFSVSFRDGAIRFRDRHDEPCTAVEAFEQLLPEEGAS